MAICNILLRVGKLYGHLVHFVFIWGIFPVLLSSTKKNLATLIGGVRVMAPSRIYIELVGARFESHQGFLSIYFSKVRTMSMHTYYVGYANSTAMY
jgi:hypothetical protein